MTRILVTGSSGFIGSTVVSKLSKNKSYDLSVCDFKQSGRFHTVHPSRLKNLLNSFDVVVHLGAVSETNAINSEQVFNKNILQTLNILQHTDPSCKIIYASSASVYGNNTTRLPSKEMPEYEKCNSKYSQSKLIIDNIVRNFFDHKNCVGLRFFNVCSFNLEHNKKQPSPTFSFNQELLKNKTITLFEDSDKVFRDFIYVDDVVDIIQFFIDKEDFVSDIFNVGSGTSISFEQVANAFIAKFGYGKKKYIPRPNNLTTNYQYYTQADISKLRSCGYNKTIPNILDCINIYERYTTTNSDCLVVS